MSRPYLQPNIPKFWLGLPKDAMINSKEVSNAFGYANTESLGNAISSGTFPRPDRNKTSTITLAGNLCSQKSMWHVSTLIREARRRIETNKKVNEK